MTKTEMQEIRFEMEVAWSHLYWIARELKRLRSELDEITDWEKWEFQQDAIRMMEGAQFRASAKMENFRNQLEG